MLHTILWPLCDWVGDPLLTKTSTTSNLSCKHSPLVIPEFLLTDNLKFKRLANNCAATLDQQISTIRLVVLRAAESVRSSQVHRIAKVRQSLYTVGLK